MVTSGGTGPNAHLRRPVDGASYEFRPVVPEDKSEAGHQSTKLLELVVLADSPDCPHPSLRGPDGHFHTGDLFEEVSPGLHANLGRDDDWIKSKNGLRCDTRCVQVLCLNNWHSLTLPYFWQSSGRQCLCYLCRSCS
jgi:hypothetical protein